MGRKTNGNGSGANAVALSIVLFLAVASLGGCATYQRPATDSPADLRSERADEAPAEESQAQPATDSSESAPEEDWPDLSSLIPAEEPIAAELLPLAEAPAVWESEEPATGSPLDELARVDPEASPSEPEESRDLVVNEAPTFDIPIEVNDRVLAWVERYSKDHKRAFEAGLARSGRYMPMFRKIFEEAGLPQDLVYMAHVESGYKTSAYSRAHAKGIFQFIAPTARRYGLRVDYWVDERSDPEKSARAAAAYMTKLYEEFGDWYLALAAYNAGEGKVRRALARSGKSDFWGIAATRHLRRETKNHVPAILAATLLSKEPQKYGLKYEPEALFEYDTIAVDGAADLRVLAKCAGTDLATMKRLNPALRRHQTPPDGRTDVRVPLGSGATSRAALDAIPAGERVLWTLHRVRRGDTLSGIAQKYGVGVRAIQQSNGMGRRTLIRVHQTLKIPTSSATRYADLADDVASTGERGELVVYRVRRGDTLYGISRRFGTSPGAIAAANDIPVHGLLSIGQRLTVVRGVRSVSQARQVAQGTTSSRSGGKVIHTVRRGDTLWHIASVYRTSVNALCSMNQISPNTILHPGRKLTVGYE